MNPYSPEQWQAIDTLGHTIDRALLQDKVGLTMGGEPTYVSATDRTDLQWRYTAMGEDKRYLAGKLLNRLHSFLAPAGSLRHYGLGKLYPGEAVPRWALGCFWRLDGEPLWRNPAWLAVDRDSIALDSEGNGKNPEQTGRQAQRFMAELLPCLAIAPDTLLKILEPEADSPTGYMLPLLTVQGEAGPYWASCHWEGLPQAGEITLLPGLGGAGMRLPLGDLADATDLLAEAVPSLEDTPIRPHQTAPLAPPNSIRLALCVEVRRETVHVFLPPIASARSFVDILTAIEATAESLDLPVLIEGYPPPSNQGIQGFQITPDPGVIEVNIHPAGSWQDLVQLHQGLDQAAVACGLTCEKFALDGRPLGTGGGSHITIGGEMPEDSPLLRRPDLLRSLITYWQHHPSLSYLFAGEYIGPTSQSPRADEARHDSLYELEVAFLSLAPRSPLPPEILDRLLRPLLVDVTGNAHRATLCIDKLFPVDNPRLQLGLLEFRGFEMPPCTELRLLQMLLVRALVAWFWQQPYTQPLRRWGADLGDRMMLPYYLEQDLQAVLTDLAEAGYPFEWAWFAPFGERRLPRYGQVSLGENPVRQFELRAALDPWPVLGDAAAGGTARPVDNSLERIQVRLTGILGEGLQEQSDRPMARYQVLCNGCPVPIRSTGTLGESVGAVRFRARAAAPGNHPAIAPHAPLTFSVIDTWHQRFVGGARYHVQAPDGSPYSEVPRTAEAAQARFRERFEPLTDGPVPPTLPPLAVHPDTPHTLDLRLWALR